MNQRLQNNFNKTSSDPTIKSNKIQPDKRDSQRKEEEGKTKSISAMYSLYPYKASSGPFSFQIKTTTKPIKLTIFQFQLYIAKYQPFF